MTTILTLFIASLVLATLLTPWVKRLARRHRWVDKPSARKVHKRSIPRIGGLAIYLAFIIPFCGCLFYSNNLIEQLTSNRAVIWGIAGASLVFLVGLVDDIYDLPPGTKFAGQAVAAWLAYQGGLQISHVELVGKTMYSLGWLSFPATLFWFLLVVNAVNLIDGLDGLAAGVSLFASLVLLALSVLEGHYAAAMGLAALSGSCLGFLRYNFNPASIFMGDSGSYFLGYMLAALGILGSMKSQATVAILIPFIALGLPLMDTLLAPIRRFIVGEGLFYPDRNHFHHKLLKMGLTHRRAVLVLYSGTVLLGFLALLIVRVQDSRAALVLLVLGVTCILGIHRLGYFESLALDSMLGYFEDVGYAMGLSRGRRTFYSRQLAIKKACSIEEMWPYIIKALEMLEIDQASLRLHGDRPWLAAAGSCVWCGHEIETQAPRNGCRVLSLDLPLMDDRESYGILHLEKDLQHGPLNQHTLRRIEHLRRSLVRKLQALREEAAEPVTGVAVAEEHNHRRLQFWVRKGSVSGKG